MKLFLFKMVGFLTGLSITASLAVGNAIGSTVAWFFNSLNMVFKAIGERLMLWIDEDRYLHASATASQIEGLTELNLLASATRVKEDALINRVWTSGHTMALNRIADGLHRSCGWEPARIHGYLRPLVESIPGVGYSTGEPPEEGPGEVAP